MTSNKAFTTLGFVGFWCQRGDSNPHDGMTHLRILSPIQFVVFPRLLLTFSRKGGKRG